MRAQLHTAQAAAVPRRLGPQQQLRLSPALTLHRGVATGERAPARMLRHCRQLVPPACQKLVTLHSHMHTVQAKHLGL